MALAYAAPRSKPQARAARDPLGSQVAQLQRSRLIAALIEAVKDDGYRALTVGKVIGLARVSRKTFYDLFRDLDDAFLAAFEQLEGRLRVLGLEAYGAEDHWQEAIRATLERLLAFMDEEPALARFLLVDSLAAGESVLEARAGLLEELAHALDRGRIFARGSLDPPPLAAPVVMGGILTVLHTHLLADRQGPFTDLASPLMSMIAMPFLGARAARRELNAPCREPSRDRSEDPQRIVEGDPLKGLKIRLTYRTARVLMAIGEQPGASNREVAERADILDQGQISKLLARLARLNLIANVGSGQPMGSSNAWHLTARGALLERAASPR